MSFQTPVHNKREDSVQNHSFTSLNPQHSALNTNLKQMSSFYFYTPKMLLYIYIYKERIFPVYLQLIETYLVTSVTVIFP